MEGAFFLGRVLLRRWPFLALLFLYTFPAVEISCGSRRMLPGARLGCLGQACFLPQSVWLIHWHRHPSTPGGPLYNFPFLSRPPHPHS